MPITERQCNDMCSIIGDWYIFHKEQPYLESKKHWLGVAKEQLKELIDKFIFLEIQYNESPHIDLNNIEDDCFEVSRYLAYWLIKDEMKWSSDVKENIKSCVDLWEKTWESKLITDNPKFPEIKIMTDDLKKRLIEYFEQPKVDNE